MRRGAVDTQQRELEEIKQAYLGKPKEKKKLTKAADKFKFMFDWEPVRLLVAVHRCHALCAPDLSTSQDQDTSRGVGPVAPGAHGAPALLFGRGMLAGVDRSVQRSEQPKSAGASVAARREERFERPAERPTRQAASSWRDKPLGEMTEREWRLFREEHNIAFKGGKLPLPFRTWEESSLPEQLVKAVQRVGYAQPSPIQMAAIPIGLSGRDVIGVAQTGSGKTCAFVLPMLAYIMRLPPMRGNEELESRGPYSLILSPTRELAQQIEEETVKFAHFLEYRCVSLVGGQDIEQQGFKLRQGCEVLIGTPGRVDDCLQRRYTVLLQCNFVVLDEADRMIDYGFEPQVVKVLDAMPSSNLKPVDLEEGAELTGGAKVYRTTFMFSATMPTAVERLARTYMRQPAVVTIGAAGKAASEIQQLVVLLRSPDEKAAQLEKWLARHAETQVIVFVNSHKVCDFVAKALERLGKSISILHGGKTQDAREAAIDAFRNKRTSILLATDVAGRGIDVPDVGLVVNYQLPATIEAYTHRIGRTGRAGRKGVAVSLATNDDAGLFFDLRNFLQDSGNVVPPELAAHPASRKKSDKGGDKFGRNIEM